MGNFYTNITLLGPDSDDVLSLLKKHNRRAFVLRSHAPFSVVYDSETENQDEDVLHHLTRLLSRELSCPALAVLNHDDDVLVYHLYSRGKKVDSYDSMPGYFEGTSESPSGGNVEALIKAFDAKCSPDELAAVLHTEPPPTLPRRPLDQVFNSGLGEWIAKIMSDKAIVADIMSGQFSDETIRKIGKMRDEVNFTFSPPTDSDLHAALQDKYTFAVDRHQDLVRALGLPDEAVGLGYQYLDEGEYPEDVAEEDFIHT